MIVPVATDVQQNTIKLDFFSHAMTGEIGTFWRIRGYRSQSPAQSLQRVTSFGEFAFSAGVLAVETINSGVHGLANLSCWRNDEHLNAMDCWLS